MWQWAVPTRVTAVTVIALEESGFSLETPTHFAAPFLETHPAVGENKHSEAVSLGLPWVKTVKNSRENISSFLDVFEE